MGMWEWVATALGFVGYTTFVAAFTRLSTWTSRQWFLRLAYREAVDIVVTTSASVHVGAHQVIDQSAVSLGDLEGAASFSKAIGDLRRKTTVVVHPSEEQSYDLDNDLVLLGGPRANHITLAFLRHLKWCHPQYRLSFTEQIDQKCVIGAEGLQIHYAPERQQRTVADTRLPPKEDFALIAAWINPFTIRPRRAFMCAGFTSLGTAAAARYLLRDVLHHRFRALTRQRLVHGLGHLLMNPRYWRKGWRWRVWAPPCFLLVLRFEFTGLNDYEVQEVKFLPLFLPARHPLEAPDPRFTDALESEAVIDAIHRAREREPSQLSYDEFEGLVEAQLDRTSGRKLRAELEAELARRLRGSDINLFRSELDMLEPLHPGHSGDLGRDGDVASRPAGLVVDPP